MCHWFCLLYSLSCMLTLTGGYAMLVLGRVAGGFATSLLFSTFESWMIAEHNKRVSYLLFSLALTTQHTRL